MFAILLRLCGAAAFILALLRPVALGEWYLVPLVSLSVQQLSSYHQTATIKQLTAHTAVPDSNRTHVSFFRELTSSFSGQLPLFSGESGVGQQQGEGRGKEEEREMSQQEF